MNHYFSIIEHMRIKSQIEQKLTQENAELFNEVQRLKEQVRELYNYKTKYNRVKLNSKLINILDNKKNKKSGEISLSIRLKFYGNDRVECDGDIMSIKIDKPSLLANILQKDYIEYFCELLNQIQKRHNMEIIKIIINYHQCCYPCPRNFSHFDGIQIYFMESNYIKHFNSKLKEYDGILMAPTDPCSRIHRNIELKYKFK